MPSQRSAPCITASRVGSARAGSESTRQRLLANRAAFRQVRFIMEYSCRARGAAGTLRHYQFIRLENAYKGRDKAGPGGYKGRPALRGMEQFMRIFSVAMLPASLVVAGFFVTGAGAEPLR